MVEEEKNSANVEEDQVDGEKVMTDKELKGKIKEEDMKFIEAYRDVKISELFTYGFIRHEVAIHGDVNAVIRTLKSKEDKELAKRLSGYAGINILVGAENGDDILEFSLVSFGDRVFNEPEEARAFMAEQSMAVKVLLVQEFKKLNKATAIMIKGPGVENPLVTPLAGTGAV